MTMRRFHPGDKVAVRKRHTGCSRRSHDGIVVAEWNWDKGNTGTVLATRSSASGKAVLSVVVVPDPECGYGECTFLSRDLRRMEEEEQ